MSFWINNFACSYCRRGLMVKNEGGSMKKSNFFVVVIISFGLALIYMRYGMPSMKNEVKEIFNSKKSGLPNRFFNVSQENGRTSKSFNFSNVEKYQKYLKEYTPGFDKNCVLTLQNKYTGYGDLPLRIPLEYEMKSLNEDVIMCLYHRYVTTLQIYCAFKNRVGEVKRKGWYICADPAYAPKKNGIVFLSNKAFSDNIFSIDIASRYNCTIHETPLSSANTLQSWIDQTNISNSIIDILTMSINAASDFALIHTMIQEKSIKKVRQLLVELHFDPKVTKKQDYIQMLHSLRLLFEIGFSIVWFDRIVYCATPRFNKCYAVYFVQPNLGDKSSTYLSLHLPNEENIRKMKTSELTDLYFKYIETTQFFCQQILRIGKLTDGAQHG